MNMNNIESEEATGSSRVVLEMLKAGGKPCLKPLTATFNDFLFDGKLSEEWMLSSLIPLFKGTGYLLKHAFQF